MIKVLKHGVKKVTCPNCRAKLEYEQEDIQEEIIPSLLGDDEIRQYIVCPDCEDKIFFKSQILMKLARCPKCNKEVKVNTSVVLTSIPAKYNLDCPNCGRQYIPCEDCYEIPTDNTTIEQNILKKIEELEKHQKEQAEVLDNIEDRLSDLEHK